MKNKDNKSGLLKSEEKNVVILISTYNGERYLREQLDSIYAQTYKRFEIYVRDDGSCDTTGEILDEYKNQYDNFNWYAGQNIGSSKSFFTLMGMIEPKEAVYVFADQDDVWKPNKLERIIGFFDINDKSDLLLYCGDTILVDGEMKVLKDENFGKNIRPSFGNALIENICIGCTCAMNQGLLKRIIQRIPEHEVMHDWWFYLTASCYGKVIYDAEPLVYYRQHEKNVMGSGTTRINRLMRRINNHKNHQNQISRQAAEFSKIYQVEGENACLLECVKDYKKDINSCWRLIKNKEICRQRKSDDLIFKLLFLCKQL